MPIVGKFDSQGKRRRKPRKLRSLAFVPATLTLGNLICGFAAIHFAMREMYAFATADDTIHVLNINPALVERVLPSFLSVGAGLVLLGMLFDMFDGLVARVTNATTDFGGQLDSLADVVSFGVAPAALMVAFMTRELAGDAVVPSPISDHPLGRLAWVAAALYVAFAAIRLARFNVEHAKADFDFRVFRGLPSPGAAAIMVAMLLFQDQPSAAPIRRWFVYAMPVLAACLAMLMVSRVPYKRFHHAYMFGKQPFNRFVTFVVLGAVFIAFKAQTLLLLVLWYGASGPVQALYRSIRGKSHTGHPADGGRTDSQQTADRRPA